VFEENFQKFLEDLELSGTDARVAVGGVFYDSTNLELSKSSCAPNLATGQAPVWTANSGRHGKVSLRAMSGNSKNTGQKRFFSKSAEEYRRYLIRVMRTGAGGISPHGEVCRSRRQIAGDVFHDSINRVGPVRGEGSLVFGRVHQYLDRC
jgi:hypothetical protein